MPNCRIDRYLAFDILRNGESSVPFCRFLETIAKRGVAQFDRHWSFGGHPPTFAIQALANPPKLLWRILVADGEEKMYVYILKSKNNNRVYVGSAEDIKLRLQQHNRGENRSTKAYIPWILVRTEEYKDKVLALKREKFLKSGCGRRVIRNLVTLQ